MGVENFGCIIATLLLVKALYDIGRQDVVKNHFSDELAMDDYYHNVHSAISYIFFDCEFDYCDADETEQMIFKDDVISKYFVYAWEYGKQNNIPYAQNVYVTQARDEAADCLTGCYSVGYKLSAYVRSKNAAKQSKLIVWICNGGCSCDHHMSVALALVHLYSWFKEKCTEFETMNATPAAAYDNASQCSNDVKSLEVMAA